MKGFPLVSCLCVTRKRPEFLARAIACFFMQDYKNKELVVVCMSDDIETLELVAQYSNPEVVIVEVPYNPNLTLGELRNISIQNSSGEYICTWDDDDWFHPQRISYQIKAILDCNGVASILNCLVLFNVETGDAYITNERHWENSLMCSKRFLLEAGISYPPMQKSEDTEFVREIRKRTSMEKVQKPQLYIYCCNGRNTCGVSHFNELFSYAKKLNHSETALVREVLRAKPDDKDTLNLIIQKDFVSRPDKVNQNTGQ